MQLCWSFFMAIGLMLFLIILQEYLSMLFPALNKLNLLSLCFMSCLDLISLAVFKLRVLELKVTIILIVWWTSKLDPLEVKLFASPYTIQSIFPLFNFATFLNFELSISLTWSFSVVHALDCQDAQFQSPSGESLRVIHILTFESFIFIMKELWLSAWKSDRVVPIICDRVACIIPVSSLQ